MKNNSEYQKARKAIKNRGGRWADLKKQAIRASDDANIEKQHVRAECPRSFRAYVEMRDAQA